MGMMKITRHQKGFTLVELAIVLVIIGIILGAVLKGQALINNAKIKRVYNQQREVLAAVYSYFDKYSFFPGDDPNAATRWAGVTSGNGNGLIGVGAGSTAPNFACTATGTEQCDLWNELRLSEFISGSGFSNPANAYGGRIALSYFTVTGGLLAHWIAFQNIPYDACQSLDLQYDDGVYNTGGIRGSGDYGTATSGVFSLYFKF
jgi:prepilin-type N-terminal cleavage/methylation domain-containing protein